MAETDTKAKTLRGYLRTVDSELADRAEAIWRASEPIHERQTSPDKDRGGKSHCEQVERNVWELIRAADQLAHFKAIELFLLSTAACCHDFDKGLLSGLPTKPAHGGGSAQYLLEHGLKLNLNQPEITATECIVNLHPKLGEDFTDELDRLPDDGQFSVRANDTVDLRRLCVVFKAADVLHTDCTRVSSLATDPQNLLGLTRAKFLARGCIYPWRVDGTRVVLKAFPKNAEEDSAVQQAFDYLKEREWRALVPELRAYRFPYQLDCSVDERYLETPRTNSLPPSPHLPCTSDIPHATTPSALSSPFVRVDLGFELFRDPNSAPDIPFPSRQEYLDGLVPVFDADAKVNSRLGEHGWAFVLDVASVGKTTLAIRVAMSEGQRTHPSFYLDLAKVDDELANDASAALQSLSFPQSLLILDNCHHEPELARRLWMEWKGRSRESRLLMLGTRIHHEAITHPAQDLAFFDKHESNPAIGASPTPDDLRRLLSHLLTRVAPNRTLPCPPADAVQTWHRHYRRALGAFCFVVFSRAAELFNGNWELPKAAAAAWVRKKWLGKLDSDEAKNATCIAAFGEQGFELQVSNDALPYPGKLHKLFELGLVSQVKRGRLGQFCCYSFREPGWGEFILGAQRSTMNTADIRFEAALRHAVTAIALNSRLHRAGRTQELARLWTTLAERADDFCSRLLDCSFSHTSDLLRCVLERAESRLQTRIWDALERQPDKFAARALETHLHFVASFLDKAKSHGRDTGPLWQALEQQWDKLVAQAWQTQLAGVGFFLDTAKSHGRDNGPLWQTLEQQPDKLAALAWQTPLCGVASFLETATNEGRTHLVHLLWNELADKPAELSERAKATSTAELSGFVVRAPDAVVSAVLSGIGAERWESIPQSEALIGGAGLAQRFGAVGRDDHKRSLVTTLLRRANYQDFPPTGGTICNVAWVLENIPDEARDLVPKFLDALCTKRWLGWHFSHAAVGPLAGGLWMLSMHQPLEICRRFHNPGLGVRLRTELQRFSTSPPEKRHQVIQLLGTSQLFGWIANRHWFDGVPLNDISQLPLDMLPQSMDAARVEPLQRNLWLGLRTVASVTGRSLRTPRELISRTFEMWKVNLAETKTQPDSREHRLNRSMVDWLRRSHKGHALVPTREWLCDVVSDLYPRSTG